MTAADRLERGVAGVARRPRRVLVLLAVLAVVGAGLALRLQPSAAVETLAARSSEAHRATERFRERFGDHAIVVLVRGPLPQLVLTDNLGRLLGLEGCLSGNRPRGRPAPGGEGGPCAALARDKPVRVVYGPGTFINAAVGELQDQLARRMRAGAAAARRAGLAARALARREGRPPVERTRLARAAERLAYAGFVRDLLQLGATYGLGVTQAPRLDDPDFVSTLVFDPARGAATPKARFAHLFPTPRSAVIQVRLRPELSDAQRRRAVALVRAAVAMPRWRLHDAAGYTVTGVPVLAEDLAGALAGATLRLLVLAVLVMALVLAVAFRRRLRILPLGVALAAVAITGGAMSVAGAPLTMASIAVLPVLLGLAVDYAVQFQARVQEERSARGAARRTGPALCTAALATAAGFLVLWLSPVPMVREFGVLLVAGVGVALVVALVGGTAALVALGARPPGLPARAARGAGELLGILARPVRPPARGAAGVRWGMLALAVRRPGRVLAVAVVLAGAGWVLDTRAPVESDLRALVPQDLPAVRDLGTLERTTGVAGEIDVLVEGRDLTDPAVVAWMTRFQQRVLAMGGAAGADGPPVGSGVQASAAGAGGGAAGVNARCGRALLCPALSLPDLFRGDAGRDRAHIRALLAAVPPYFSRAVITADRRTAVLAFGIKNVPLAEQAAVIARMRAALDPPPGVRAAPAGLPVLAADAHEALASPWRRLGTLVAGLLAVALVLLAVYRRARRAWVPLVPIALATGWSALVLAASGVPLNPMSATLGALVLAISTEFAVLLCSRFAEERAAGEAVPDALRRTYATTGAAVLASGATVLAGFAVPAASDVEMLRAFGIVTVIDLSASLLGVVAVLPAVLVLAERGTGPRVRRLDRAADAPAVAA